MSSKIISSTSVTFCPVCGTDSSTSEVKELPAYPLTELYSIDPPKDDYLSSTTLDQVFCYCSNCAHGYLKEVISPEFLYAKDNYNTITTMSQGSVISVNNFASFVCKNTAQVSSYSIDIGGNDSNLLKKIGRSNGCVIDPNASSDSSAFACINKFVEEINPDSFSYDSVDIVSSHTLEHIQNPHVFFDFIKRIKNVSNVFIQVPCLECMVTSSRFDLVHHQHLHYFSLKSISQLALSYGFVVSNFEYDLDHYGTLRVHLVKGESTSKIDSLMPDYDSLYSLNLIRDSFNSFSSITHEQSLKISNFPNLYCYGASLMLPIVFYYYPCLNELCSGILDQDLRKSKTWYANVNVPIIHDDNYLLSDKSLIVSAVATRSACRKIVKNTVDRNPLHMFIPFGEF